MAGSLRDIRLFVAAYEERSFTAAAEREHATQSGVSQHIRNLEDSFNVKLFLRDKGRVTPSPAGDVYYQHCIEVLRAHEAAARSVRHFTGGFAGEITVGLMPTMTRCTLTPALARFVESHPNTAVRVLEGYSATLTELVRAGELDFAIVPAIEGQPGLRSEPFLRTTEVLVSNRRSGLRHLSPVRLADLAPLKLVLGTHANVRRRTLEAHCAAHGIAVARMVELDAMLGTLDFVARTDWLTVLPAIMMANEIEHPRVTVSPIVDPSLALDLAMIEPSRKMLTPAAKVFYGMLKEAAEELNRHWLHTIGAEAHLAAEPQDVD
jgi:DNA-binding transcriptional LysR family regulator